MNKSEDGSPRVRPSGSEHGAGAPGSRAPAELIDGLPAALFEVRIDRDDRLEVTWFSAKLAALFDVSPQVLDDGLDVLWSRIVADDRVGLDAAASEALDEGGTFSHSFRIARSDGALRWLRLSAEPKAGANGSTVWRGLVEDTTSERLALDATGSGRRRDERIEERLMVAQRLESLGLLAGGIAHDLGNLLVAMLGNAELARLELEGDGQTSERLAGVELAARKASSLCNQMLAYVGKTTTSTARVNVYKLINDMTDLLRVSIPPSIELMRHIERDLSRVQGDPSQLQQVVMNLVTNAADAIGDGGGRITIRAHNVQCTAEYLAGSLAGDELPGGEYVVLEVADTGAGMTEETRSRMFDPFFTTKSQGRGLGLAAVLGIARSHGAAIQAYSRPEHGTRMRLYFPAAPEEDDEVEDREQGSYRGAAITIPGKVLVIDDDELVMRVVCGVLERAGYEVLSACNGREGLTAFEANAADVAAVVLDMAMPVLNGYDTLVELRSKWPTVPVVVASGYFDGAESFEGLGVNVRILKPYSPRDLLKAVSEAIGSGMRRP